MAGLITSISSFLYELTRRRPSPRRSALHPDPMIVGHRGSPCHEIENTIPSFDRALRVDGANGIELDLCLTSDGEVVVWHDWDPDSVQTLARSECLEPDVRCCPSFPDEDGYRRRVSQLCLEDVRSHFGYAEKDEPANRLEAAIPTFAEFMEWAAGQRRLKTLFLDIKIPADELGAVAPLMSRVQEILSRAPVGFRVIFETAEPEVLKAMQRYSPTNCYTLDVGPSAGLVLRPERHSAVRAALEHGNRYATLMYPRATVAPAATFRRIVRHDMKLMKKKLDMAGQPAVEGLVGFTINDEDQMRWLLALGIHGMQTDRPDVLARVLGQMRSAAAGVDSKRRA